MLNKLNFYFKPLMCWCIIELKITMRVGSNPAGGIGVAMSGRINGETRNDRP